MAAEELERWLLGLPLDELCDIDGERVYLRLGSGGAELGLLLISHPSEAQIGEAMRTGFQGRCNSKPDWRWRLTAAGWC